MSIRPIRFAATLCALAVAGCGSSGVQPDDLAATALSSSSGEYLIGAGDNLEIFVWRQPELSVTVPVRPDGRISTPLVEDLVAVGKTPTQLAGEIAEVLSEYIRTPQVNVIVRDFVGVSGEQIRVLGQVNQPGAVPYRERMTLLDVLLEVGGLTEFAAGNRSRVVRNAEGDSREIRVRLEDLANRGDLSQNLSMRPGDVVIVPEVIF